MANCCGLNHVWGDHLFLVCDYCRIEREHFRGSDAAKGYAEWIAQHRHDGEPCPAKEKKWPMLLWSAKSVMLPQDAVCTLFALEVAVRTKLVPTLLCAPKVMGRWCVKMDGLTRAIRSRNESRRRSGWMLLRLSQTGILCFTWFSMLWWSMQSL